MPETDAPHADAAAEGLSERELAEIEARANAARRGPWTVNDGQLWANDDDWEQVLSCCNMDDHSLAFAAASRTDVPALIAEVRRLQRALQAAGGPAAEGE